MTNSLIKGTEITCVATLYKGVIYVIPAPAEHLDVIIYIEQYLNESLDGTQEHGFLTEKDEFISLSQGFDLAKQYGKFKYVKL